MFDSLHRPLAALSALVLPLLYAASGSAQTEWDPSYYNPSPSLDREELLPLPCGGRMTFRIIRTPVPEDPLADMAIMLGQASDETGYSEYIRRAYLAGSLTESPLGVRTVFFLMSKYEVTQDQYDAVMAEECPQPSMRGRLPVTGLTWFDAIAFTRAYTEWLYENAPEALPVEGERRGYVRLPTEEEWEYAVRGGDAVSEQDFRRRHFPLEGDLVEYAWFQGPRSAGGQLQLVGLLEPNPLGLHDMLGNAEEFVLEPYRMNRIGRPHGQVGGFVTRGGSFRTPASSLRSSLRVEYSYFDETTGAATDLDTFGMRLIVSAPVNVSLQRTQELRDAWQTAVRMRAATIDDFDPLEALQTLAEDSVDLGDQQTLERIRAEVAGELAARDEIEGRALRRAISSGAVLALMLRYDHRLIEGVRTAFEYEERINPDSDRVRQLRGRLEEMGGRFDNTLRAYVDVLVQAADDYTGERHEQQLEVELQSLEGRGLDTLIPFAELFTAQALAYQNVQELDVDQIMAEILR